MITNNPSDSDVEVCSVICRAIGAAYEHDRVMQLDPLIPVELKIVYFTDTVVGHAECNGYVTFLMMKCEHSFLSLCFRELGLTDLSEVVDQMLAPVAGKGVLGNEEALEKHFSGWEAFAEWVAQFEPELFASFSRIISTLANYCRNNATIFGQLGPEIQKALNGTDC